MQKSSELLMKFEPEGAPDYEQGFTDQPDDSLFLALNSGSTIHYVMR